MHPSVPGTPVAKVKINRAKRQHAEWEKIFAKHISDKELTSKICSEY